MRYKIKLKLFWFCKNSFTQWINNLAYTKYFNEVWDDNEIIEY